MSIEMTGTVTWPNVTPSARAVGFAAMVLALLILRCLPLRVVLAVASMIGRLGVRPAGESAALDAIASWRQAARWYPGRAAVICTPVYYAETARSTAHVRGRVTASRGLRGITVGAASYVDMGGEINTNFKVPMFYIDATRDCNGQPTWISVAWRGRYLGHDPRQSLTLLSGPGHREPRNLTPDVAGHRQAWRDFRAYCAACDNGTNLTSYGTPDGDTGIGFSSGNNAAVLTDAGTIIANAAASPALAKLRDHLRDWDNAGRPGLSTLIATAESRDDGLAVRLALPSF